MTFGGHPVALAVRLAVGVGLVVAGWVGASDEVALDRQAPWVAVATAGALVAATSAAIWLLTARRAVVSRALAVVAALDALPEPDAAAVEDDGRRARRRDGSPQLYHRLGCPLLAGRRAEVGDPVPWQVDGAAPCGVCGP